MSKPIRAKLVGRPYETMDGRWRAAARIGGHGDLIALSVPADMADQLDAGDTVAVLRNGMEWRVG